MKKLTPIKLALTFAGCFLGAGYVSGQELWQFFGVFGKGGFFGVVLAAALLFGMAALLLRLAQDTGIDQVDRLVVGWDIKALRWLMAGLELVFLFGVGTIMSAGVGALLRQLFAVPAWIGCAVFALIVSVMAMAGLRGIVSAFSFTVPVLAAASVAFGAVSLCQNGVSALPAATHAGGNPMMPVWFVGAVTFACYNVFGSFAILTPFARFIPDKKTTFLGTALGALVLLLIALSVLAALCAAPEALSAQLPMLALASAIHPALGYGYGALLLLAMFGTALSSAVTFVDFVCAKSEKLAVRRPALLGVYGALMFAGSLAGFGGLIGTVYPVFGYASSVFVVLLILHGLRFRKQRKNAESGVIS